ncbi:MAG: hypothetical protein U0169_02350 [Polyangiaceae bacterium]
MHATLPWTSRTNAILGVFATGLLASLPTSAHAQLAPPPPMGTMPSSGVPSGSGNYVSSPTASTLSRAEKEDSGRGLEWVYANAEVGAGLVASEAFANDAVGLQNLTAVGPMFGVGAGVRLLVLTFGARFRVHALSPFTLAQIDAEAGFHVPLGKWDPYVALRGGYDFTLAMGDGAFSPLTLPSKNDVAYRGFNLGLSGGCDYYLSSLFSVGADVTFDTLFLSRPRVAAPTPTVAAEPLYARDGSTAGIGLALSLHAGLHF